MKIFQSIKRGVKPFVDYRSWMDMERVKSGITSLKSTFHTFFVPHKAIHPESLEDTMVRYNLDEKDVNQRMYAFKRLALIMAIVLLAIFSYCIYHLVSGNLRAALISASLSLVCVALVFRYHFWYFQLKQRKLGCSFNDWFKATILGKKL